MKKKYLVLFFVLALSFLIVGCSTSTEAETTPSEEELFAQICWENGGTLESADSCVLPKEEADCPECPSCPECEECEVCEDETDDSQTDTTGTTLGYNTGLLIGLGFPGSDWIIPEEVQGWACPQQIPEGSHTFGPYTTTKDAETRVWIGFEDIIAEMPYTYSYAACINPSEALTEQPFWTGADRNPIDGKIFNVIFDDKVIDREVQFPD